MNAQFKKGVLELCVLSLLLERDQYGYELTETLADKMEIAEGTIYPILRRLHAEGYFSAYIQESSGGPPRKYYSLTPKGRLAQAELAADWVHFAGQVSELIGGDILEQN